MIPPKHEPGILLLLFLAGLLFFAQLKQVNKISYTEDCIFKLKAYLCAPKKSKSFHINSLCECKKIKRKYHETAKDNQIHSQP